MSDSTFRSQGPARPLDSTPPASPAAGRSRGPRPAVAPSRRAAFVHLFGPSLLVLAVFSAFVLAVPGLRHQVFGEGAGPGLDDPATINEVARLLNQHFYRGDVDTDNLLRSAIRGMVRSLNDPYTSYLPPREHEHFQRETTGRFAGLGVQLVLDDDGFPMVFTPFPDTPAYRAGLRPGDRILRVDGRETHGEDFQRVIVDDWLRGPHGSAVTLDVRDVNGKAKTVTVVRGDVRVPSISVSRMLDQPDAARRGVGYLRIDQFQSGATSDVVAEIDRMRENGLRTLLFDLRGNRGGLLLEARDLAGLFLPRGTLIVSTRGNDPETAAAYSATADSAGRFLDLGVIVLVDRHSASASEVFAGALQDHHRAVVIGEQTFGKGLVQMVFPLGGTRSSSGAVRITTATYVTPAGRNIQRAEAYRVCPTSGNRYPATDEYLFSPVTGEPLEDDPHTAGQGYRGGIEPDVHLPLSDEVYSHLTEVMRHERVFGGAAEWVGSAKRYRDEPFEDPHVAAALAVVGGRAVAQAAPLSSVSASAESE